MHSIFMGHPATWGSRVGRGAGLRRNSSQVLFLGASPVPVSHTPKSSWLLHVASHCTDACGFSPLRRGSIIEASWKPLALGMGTPVSSQASAFSEGRRDPKRFSAG